MVTLANSSIAVIRVTIALCLEVGGLLGTDGEGTRKHSGQGNGDITDQEGKDVIETTTAVVKETGVEDRNVSKNEDTNENKAERTDLSGNLLQVIGGVITLTDKRCSTTEESVGTSGNDNILSLSLLASRTAIERQFSARIHHIKEMSLTRSTGDQVSCSVGEIHW